MKLKKSKKLSKKLAVIAVILIMLVIASAVLYVFVFNKNFHGNNTPVTSPNQEINYNPPTSQEIKESEDIKKNTVDPQKTTQNTANVNVVVANTYVNGSNLEIRAFVLGIVEGNGNCSAVLTKDSTSVNGSSKAFADATTTQCEPIVIPLSKFPQSGNWSLKVNYSSEKYSGVSQALEVQL